MAEFINKSKYNDLLAITFNNFGCLYRKISKPKIALFYLNKALDLEIKCQQNPISIAKTHLNLCAVYSSLKKHQKSIFHVY